MKKKAASRSELDYSGSSQYLPTHSKYFFKGAEDFSCGLLSKFDIPHSKTAIEVKNSLVFLLNAALSSKNHVYKMVRDFVTVIFSFQEERKKSKECHLYQFTYFFYIFFWLSTTFLCVIIAITYQKFYFCYLISSFNNFLQSIVLQFYGLFMLFVLNQFQTGEKKNFYSFFPGPYHWFLI